MILSIKLHTLEVTLSSMTLGVLKQVQRRNWRFLGSSFEKKAAETELKNQLHAIWYLALSLYNTV